MSWAKYSGYHFAMKQGLPPATVTTDGNGTGFDRLGYLHALADLNVGAVSGTSETLDIKVQDSADNSTGWADYVPDVLFANNLATGTTAAFPQLDSTVANSIRKLDIDLGAAKRYIRFVKTVGGTTPSFLCSVGVFLDQRQGTVPGGTS